MQALDDAIMEHLKQGRVDPASAYNKAVNKDKFRPFLTESPDDFTEV